MGSIGARKTGFSHHATAVAKSIVALFYTTVDDHNGLPAAGVARLPGLWPLDCGDTIG